MATNDLNFSVAGGLHIVSDSPSGLAVETDLSTALSDFDTAAAAIIAITGDTYSTVTHQFTFGGATGLTHAQWATVGAQLNTAINDVVTTQTASANINRGDLSVSVNSTAFQSKGQLVQALRDAADQLAQILGIK